MTSAAADAETKGPRPRQLIVTVYGLFSRDHDGWLSVGSLVRLLGTLGIEEPAVRSSISRLKRRGVLDAERRGAAAGYTLSAEGRAVLAEGDHRIFSREPASLQEGWLLAVFSVPEAERSKRHVLRTQLGRLGFGQTAGGVWIAPERLRGTTIELLRRHQLDTYTDLFHADHVAFGDLGDKIRQWWDLDGVERACEAFLAAHGPVRARWEGHRTIDAEDAFTDYIPLLTDWRRLPYLDPGLPRELLPDNWAGTRAADLFFDLGDQLRDPARGFAQGVIDGR